MVDLDTFATILYVSVDDYCKSSLPAEPIRSGRAPALSRSEIITLALLSQWDHFRSERDFYRAAHRHLRSAFPRLPNRTQFNRLLRSHEAAVTRFGLWLADQVGAREADYEVMDCTAVRTRNRTRRGDGWLPAQTSIGWSTRLGFFHGFRLLVVVSPSGVITGYGFASAQVQDRLLADTLLALRTEDDPPMPSCGHAAWHHVYLADGGFASYLRELAWAEECAACVYAPPPKKRQHHILAHAAAPSLRPVASNHRDGQ